MHINPKHRHGVAAPLFALLLLLQFQGVSLSTLATSIGAQREEIEMLSAAETDRPIALENGLYGTLMAGSDAAATQDGLTLARGAVTAASKGFIRVTAGEATLVGFHGAIDVAVVGDKLTVAALSTPVLLTRGQEVTFLPLGSQMIVQAGNQQSRLLPLPSGYARDRLASLVGQTPVPLPLPKAIEEDLGPVPTANTIQLPPAVVRAEDVWAARVPGRIVALLQAHRAADAVVLIEAGGGILSRSKELAVATPSLLGEASGELSLVFALMPFLQGSDLRMLAFLHPDLRAAAWLAMDTASFSEADRQFVLRMFPLSDLLADAAPSLVMERWKSTAMTELQSLENPQSFAEKLAQSIDTSLSVMEKRGFPERSTEYADATRAFADSFPDVPWPTETGAAIVEVTDAPVSASLVTDPAKAAGSASSGAPRPPAPADPALVEARVREALGQAGALFTVQTQIHPVTDSTADVTGIVFSGPDGEHAYQFTFNCQTFTLSRIRRDGGEEMPFALPIEAFTTWAAGQ